MPLIRATNRLWLPGQKPNGPVKINASHPFANALQAYVLHGQRQGADYDLVSSSGYFPWSNRTVVPGAGSITNLGPATRYGSSGSSITASPANFVLAKSSDPVTGQGDFTMACQVIFRSKAAAYTEIAGQSDVSVTNYAEFYTTSSGDLRFELTSGAITFLTFANIVLDTPYTLIVTRVGTAHATWINSVLANTTSFSLTNIIASGMLARYGAWDTGFSSSPGNTFDILWSAGWNRALSADEIAALSANPYDLLVPDEGELPALFVSGAPGASVGSAAGVATAAAVGSATASSQGAAAGTGLAAAVGTGIQLAQGAAAGAGTANGISGAITSSAVGTAAGVGVAAAIGTGIKPAQGQAAGTGGAAAIGAAVVSAVGASAGAGIATGIAGGTFFGTATGTGTAQAVGKSLATAQGAAAGIGTAQALGTSQAVVTAVGNAAGIGTAQASPFVPLTLAVGAASGFGIALAVGRALVTPPVAPVPYPSRHDYGWYDRMPPIRGRGRR